jgi:hypothetical protein
LLLYNKQFFFSSVKLFSSLANQGRIADRDGIILNALVDNGTGRGHRPVTEFHPIKDDRAWIDDLRQSGERLRNFDLPPLTVPLQ